LEETVMLTHINDISFYLDMNFSV